MERNAKGNWNKKCTVKDYTEMVYAEKTFSFPEGGSG